MTRINLIVKSSSSPIELILNHGGELYCACVRSCVRAWWLTLEDWHVCNLKACKTYIATEFGLQDVLPRASKLYTACARTRCDWPVHFRRNSRTACPKTSNLMCAFLTAPRESCARCRQIVSCPEPVQKPPPGIRTVPKSRSPYLELACWDVTIMTPYLGMPDTELHV